MPCEFVDESGVERLRGEITGTIAPTGGTLGFFGKYPVVIPVVNNATAGELLTALATLGLVVDNT